MTAPAQDTQDAPPISVGELQDRLQVLEAEAYNERVRARNAELAHAADMRRWAEREAWYAEEVAKRDLRIEQLERDA